MYVHCTFRDDCDKSFMHVLMHVFMHGRRNSTAVLCCDSLMSRRLRRSRGVQNVHESYETKRTEDILCLTVLQYTFFSLDVSGIKRLKHAVPHGVVVYLPLTV